MNILAIIPARGGSKGIPRKNLKLLADKPLILYSIEAAVNSKNINKIIVSTDDKEIAAISGSYNVEVIIRPKELSTDNSHVIDTVLHVLNSLNEGYDPDIIVLLQPTSPLRTSEDIDQAVELFNTNKKTCNSVVSVTEAEHSPFLGLKMENGYIIPAFGKKYFEMRRQELPKSFIPNGSIFVTTKEHLCKFKSFYGEKILPYVMQSYKSVDIDSNLDFQLCEIILSDYND